MTLRQLDHRQLHRTIDRQSNGAFFLIDPTVTAEAFIIFFADRFQFFLTGLGSFLLVIIAARAGADHHEDQQPEKQK